MGTEAVGQEPTTPSAPAGQEPATAGTNGSGDPSKTFSAEYVAGIRKEAAENRVEAKRLSDELTKLKGMIDSADQKKAEEQGKFQDLYTKSQQALEAEKAANVKAFNAAKSEVLSMKLRSEIVNKGVPAALVNRLKIPTDGLTVEFSSEGFKIEGDLDAVVKGITEDLGDFIRTEPAAAATPAATKPAILLGERPTDSQTSDKVTADNVGDVLTAAFKKDGLG